MNIQKMKDAIIKTDAYRATSWDPEKRIKREASDFEKTAEWIKELCGSYGVDPERFIEKRFKLCIKSNGKRGCIRINSLSLINLPENR